MTENPELTSLRRYWTPRHWPTWAWLWALRLVVLLPQRARMACGRALGRLVRRVMSTRRAVVRTNLEICFPELGIDALDALEVATFESLGMFVIEQGMARWCSQAEVERLVEVHGLEHVEAALERGKGVLLLSGHFASAEFAVRPVTPHLPPIAALYRPSNDPFRDQIMRRFRMNVVGQHITRNSIRGLLKALRDNRLVWYAADQAYKTKGSVLAPFFGEPALTVTTVSQIARMSGAAVIPYLPARTNDGRNYRVEFGAPLEDFPTGDPVADATRVNRILEAHIREYPEQYYWVHRRFKHRPGLEDPYE